MPLIGNAIALIAESMGGQLMLELPDDLPPSFVREIVDGANERIVQQVKFAMFVHEARDDVKEIMPRVDFRELAMFRQGRHLAVTYASKNRGMSTYSSVYPLLLSSGFPSIQSGEAGAGVATLEDFSAALSVVLIEECSSLEISHEQLASVTRGILKFLADAYELSVGGQASVSRDWWLHVKQWAENVVAFAGGRGSRTGAFLYGAAGLPNPASSGGLAITPKDYVRKLESDWIDADGIRVELGRLGMLGDEASGAKTLEKIDWANVVESSEYDSGSAVARVAASATADQELKTEGWAAIDEATFKSSSRNDRMQMEMRRNGKALPSPFPNAVPVLVATAGDQFEPGLRSSTYLNIEIVVPLSDGAEVPSAVLNGVELPQVRVQGVGTYRGSSFTLKSAVKVAGSMHLLGDLTIKTGKAKQSDPAISLEAPEYLRKVEPLKFVQIRSSECALWLKEESSKRQATRFCVVDAHGAMEATLLVNKPSRYEFALAWGHELPFDQSTWQLGDEHLECSSWSSADGAFAIGTEDLTSTVELRPKPDDACNLKILLDVASTAARPLSPFVAAATGARPATDRLLEPSVLGKLEAEFNCIIRELAEGHALGAIQASSSKVAEQFETVCPGTKAATSLAGRLDIYPAQPSAALLELPEYKRLRESYAELGLVELSLDTEGREKSGELTVSRLPLDSLDRERIGAVMSAYREVLSVSANLQPSDRFWARNPFSVAVYPVGSGVQQVCAVLLSPLHPIRLAWSWEVQVGLREAYDDSASPSASLSLLDGTNFPALVSNLDAFQEEEAFLPVPVDARPSDLYIGWHVSVPVSSGSPAIPDWLQGERFPAEGLSSLTPSSISTAVDDFLRVSPEVQTLRIAVTSNVPTRRSNVMDEGLLSKLRELAESSAELEGVSSVNIKDSVNRHGDIPPLGRLGEALLSARPGFNLTWHTAPDGDVAENHVTFVEGGAARAGFSLIGKSLGWLPDLPLRRTPVRKSAINHSVLDYSLNSEASRESGLANALLAYEQSDSGKAWAVKIMPNFSGATANPNWLVAGDFGVDPQSLAGAVASHVGGSYVLWDWRPATTVSAGRGGAMRVQPYFVLASVPGALSGAIRDRLSRLNSVASESEIRQRAKLLVTTLAKRAIGLNTLLSVGHHQATGAIGFFFALSSLQRWVDEAPAGELRLVLPVDAVDPFLRDTVGYPKGDNRRRADLIAISAQSTNSGLYRVNLIPIEIKHYGLVKTEREVGFPKAGEERLREHAEQLKMYKMQLAELCAGVTSAVGSKASMLRQRLLAVLDAGLQLNNTQSADAVEVLRSVAEGRAQFATGTGILIWYQAFAKTEDGETATWDEFGGDYGDESDRRIEIRINPAEYDSSYWGASAVGRCHDVVLQALSAANEDQIREADELDGQPVASPEPVKGGEVELDVRIADIDSRPPNGESPDGVAEIAARVSTASTTRAEARLSSKVLEHKYDQLISALSEFHVKVNRPKDGVPYKEGPAFVEYSVVPAYGVSVNRVEAQIQNLKLRMGLAADMQLGCSTHMGNIVISVPKDDSERYFVDAEEMWQRWKRPRKGFVVPVGEDSSGEIAEIDFSSSNSPHLLIAGVTGSGKSEALLTILHGAAKFYSSEELKLKLIDPKGTELNTLEGLPHTDGPIGSMAEDAVELLASAVDEMEERYRLFKSMPGHVRSISEYQASGGEMARWILVLDEYADLTSDDDERKKIEQSLRRISQKARAAGIHVIVSTQKPVVSVVNTVVKGNLPGKIALRVNTATESRVVLDEGGAEQLAGKGDAIIKTGNGRMRIQFARYDVAGVS